MDTDCIFNIFRHADAVIISFDWWIRHCHRHWDWLIIFRFLRFRLFSLFAFHFLFDCCAFIDASFHFDAIIDIDRHYFTLPPAYFFFFADYSLHWLMIIFAIFFSVYADDIRLFSSSRISDITRQPNTNNE